VCVISINRDCDGPKNAVIIDEDGTLVGGSGGAILPRAEKFSEGSFFGLPFTDTVNKPYMKSTFVLSWENDSPAWYPNGRPKCGALNKASQFKCKLSY